MPVSFDTNVLLYAAQMNDKGLTSRSLISNGGIISVQCLDEIANVTRRKLRLTWSEVLTFTARIREQVEVVPLTAEVHDTAMLLAERYLLSVYDGNIVAAALLAGCGTLWSEDMHDGLVVQGTLTIRNPFA